MSWNRTARASKTKAALKISAMMAEQLPPADSSLEAELSQTSDDSSTSKLSLKFRKDVWNSYTPNLTSSSLESKTSGSLPEFKAGQKRKRKPPPVKTEDEAPAKVPKRSPVRRQCKVKLTRFHYGSPDRREGGKYRDMISLETPCLQPTCASCWTYHAHLMRNICETKTRDNLPASRLNVHQSREHGISTAPRFTVAPARAGEAPRRLTLKLRFNTSTPSPVEVTSKHNNSMPNSTLGHISPTAASPTTGWRATQISRQREAVGDVGIA
jgi:hypothetical protein